MSDDLVAQLREQASSDHIRGCQGRQYACDCGYDLRNEGVLEQAATALTEARAEIDMLRDTNDRVARVDNSLAKQLRASIENNAALVNELSTLRARVREVVGPFARADRAIGSEPGPFRFETGTGHRLIERGDLAAASRFMEELK